MRSPAWSAGRATTPLCRGPRFSCPSLRHSARSGPQVPGPRPRPGRRPASARRRSRARPRAPGPVPGSSSSRKERARFCCARTTGSTRRAAPAASRRAAWSTPEQSSTGSPTNSTRSVQARHSSPARWTTAVQTWQSSSTLPRRLLGSASGSQDAEPSRMAISRAPRAWRPGPPCSSGSAHCSDRQTMSRHPLRAPRRCLRDEHLGPRCRGRRRPGARATECGRPGAPASRARIAVLALLVGLTAAPLAHAGPLGDDEFRERLPDPSGALGRREGPAGQLPDTGRDGPLARGHRPRAPQRPRRARDRLRSLWGEPWLRALQQRCEAARRQRAGSPER